MIVIRRYEIVRLFLLASLLAGLMQNSPAQTKLVARKANADDYASLRKNFLNPPKSAHPWVFWYWMYASVTKQGITADLEAMKEAGIGGAYLMPIKDVVDTISIRPAVRQLTPEWWNLVRHSLTEAKRLGLDIGMHISDGFALAGGPWITPELSMQKVVWSDTTIEGGQPFTSLLPEPQKNENYYRDIAVFAYPIQPTATTRNIIPKVSTSPGTDAGFLARHGNRQTFSSSNSCWIQYEFDQPFTCRTIVIRTNGNNFQAHRLAIEVSDDGVSFRSIGRLKPPRHGWQDADADVTHVIEPVQARFFRFVYDKSGSEPGSEDLDAAKWSPTLRLRGIELSDEPRIHQFEGKNGSVWRVSERTDDLQLPDKDCIRKEQLINLSSLLDARGLLNWNAPTGRWKILRMGHTSTGHTNATGGGAKGLECDKFNPTAIRLQFDRWFGETIRVAGPELTRDVLKVMHVDSWECGSQNWSPLFREEFRARRGYDLLEYLPVMAGVPIETAAFSEQLLYDIRQTITELVVDKFYAVLSEEAGKRNIAFSAESVAPTMLSDGLMHYQKVDLPMGEFWLRSPTHDKPNDMYDAISGAHIYGKKIVQAESFTELRMAWDEHPGMLKSLGDRNYALGINKLVYHVFVHNPWLDRKPGMTLDGIGLYFQRDQTWWKKSSAWIDYAKRCQSVLQSGQPVTDVAVFIGEELPRRSMLPNRLVSSLPGIFGKDIVARERDRLANEGQPLRELPAGVRHSANMADPENWIDPLRGYAYDSFNPDALLRLARVTNGKIELPGGASYSVLVVPRKHEMSPANIMSSNVANRLQSLVKAGAKIIIAGRPVVLNGTGFFDSLWLSIKDSSASTVYRYGIGHISTDPYSFENFDTLGISKDFVVTGESHLPVDGIAWTHRRGLDYDVYFISNQHEQRKDITVSLRESGRVPEIWDAVTGEMAEAREWAFEKVTGRTRIPLQLEKNASCFIVLHRRAETRSTSRKKPVETVVVPGETLNKEWNVNFKSESGAIIKSRRFSSLQDWTAIDDTAVKYFSGTAVYTKEIDVSNEVGATSHYFLELGKVSNIAEVFVNGISCGVIWTYPFRADISRAIRRGKNLLSIEVTNTWANRLIGDQLLSPGKRSTETIAPFRLLQGKPLLEAGLFGSLQIVRVR